MQYFSVSPLCFWSHIKKLSQLNEYCIKTIQKFDFYQNQLKMAQIFGWCVTCR
jgi:hypothetical protein